MKRILLCVVIASSVVVPAAGDEGMWQPHQLPALGDELLSLGLEIDPEALSDLTSHPMAAVVSLGGCSASLVSPEGLVVTNHHCAEGSIQYNSTEERNLLKSGFLAVERAQELPARPGTRVYVTEEVGDVSKAIEASIPPGVEGRERYEAIDAKRKQLIAECEQAEGYRCSVRSYHGGLTYQLIKQLEIRDVRLVHAPAGAIGVYGGDVDNWMWPRHTGDYSFYRAYVGKDGKPAEYSEDNVPFRPQHYLRVSSKGIESGDLVLVVGYPGTTNRYRLATEVENAIGWSYPTRIQRYGEWIEILERQTADNPDAKIKYTSLISGLNNATKNYRGMLTGFAKSDIVERKMALEAELQRWIEDDPTRVERYKSALDDLRTLVSRQQSIQVREFYYDYLARRSSLLRAARRLYRLSQERQKPDLEREPGFQERDIIRIEEEMRRLDRAFDPGVDQAFWRHFILAYVELPAEQHNPVFDEWFGIEGDAVNEEMLDAKLDAMVARSTLGDLETRLAWMDAEPDRFKMSDDPFIQLAVKLYDSDLELEAEAKDLEGRFATIRPRYMESIIAYRESQGQSVYADANSTLRVTYGTIQGYSPREAIAYAPFTTLEGIVQKHTGEEPFDATEKQLATIKAGRFAGYADTLLGSVPVNFLSTVDTTGGNSGSPTLNGKAELVGLLFDGNWESIVSDWDFNPELTRSIHVDMRYVLWVMEELDGAHALLREMGVAPAPDSPQMAPRGR